MVPQTIKPSTNVPTTNKYGSTVVAAAYSKLGCPYVWGEQVDLIHLTVLV